MIEFISYIFLLFRKLIMASFSYSIWLDLDTFFSNSGKDLIIFHMIISGNSLSLEIILEPSLCLPMWKGFPPSMLLSSHPGASCPYTENLLSHFCSLDSSFYSFLVSSFAVVEHRVCRKYIFWGSSNVFNLIFVALII